MALIVIGTVKSGSGNNYEVKWDPQTKEVYVSYGGSTYIGEADSASEAMIKAEAWLYDK